MPAYRFCKFECTFVPLLLVIFDLANMETWAEGSDRPCRSAKKEVEGWSLPYRIRAFRAFSAREFTPVENREPLQRRFLNRPIVELLTLRAKIPPFTPKPVQHSSKLPDPSHKENENLCVRNDAASEALSACCTKRIASKTAAFSFCLACQGSRKTAQCC
jgi:hypothetical protein